VEAHGSKNPRAGSDSHHRHPEDFDTSLTLEYHGCSVTPAKYQYHTMAGIPYSVSLSQVRKDEILHHSHGRAPWYDMNGTPNQAYVIGIAGGSASGKV
jgi:hypothetical protein